MKTLRIQRHTLMVALVAVVATFVALSLLAAAFAPEASSRLVRAALLGRRVVKIGASAHTAQGYRLEALRRAIESETRYRVTLVETRGSLDNADRLARGELDLALIQGGLDLDAKRLRALASLAEEHLHLIVPAGSEIRRASDLAGRKVYAGERGGGSHGLDQTLFSVLDLGTRPTVVDGAFEDVPELLRTGRADAALLVAPVPSDAVHGFFRDHELTLLPLEGANALSRLMPGTVPTELPRGAYGVGRTVPAENLETLAVHMNLVARPETDPAVIHAALDAVYSVPYRRSAGLPLLSEEGGQRSVDLPLHRAAIAFYERNAPVSSDRFEIAAFFLGLLLALISAVRYLMDRLRHRRETVRRGLIRPYFERLVDLGGKIEAATPEETSAILEELGRDQREAQSRWLRRELATEDMENLYTAFFTQTLAAFRHQVDVRLAAFGREQRAATLRLDALESALNPERDRDPSEDAPEAPPR